MRWKTRTLASIVVLLSVFHLGEVLAQPVFQQTIAPSTIGSGSSARLRFHISATAPTTNIAFGETLPGNLRIATPSLAETDCQDATLTAPDGGSTIAFSGARLGSGANCSVSLLVTATTAGSYVSTSGSLSSSQGSSGTSTANLEVVTNRVGIVSSFSPSALHWGEVSTLTLTLDGSSLPSAAQIFLGTTRLDGAVVASPANARTTCNSSVTAVSGSDTFQLSFFGLLAGTTCTVSVDVKAQEVGSPNFQALSAQQGTFPQVAIGMTAAALEVTRDVLHMNAEFLDDPVAPGESLVLQVKVSNFHRNNDALAVAFTMDLDSALSGLVASGLPISAPCGAGSTLSGTGSLSLGGGLIPAGSSCTFNLNVDVPSNAVSGSYEVTSANLSATIGGNAQAGNDTRAKLSVNSVPRLDVSFAPSPVAAGQLLTMTLRISNDSNSDATDIAWRDNLSDFLPGVSIETLPGTGFCGAGSQAFDATDEFGTFSQVAGIGVVANTNCSFEILLRVPLNTPNGSYSYRSAQLQATQQGQTETGHSATASVAVVSAPHFSKFFAPTQVMPGDSLTLQYRLTLDENAVADAQNLSFSDDLTTALSGLTATNLPLSDVCGAGSQLSGVGEISLSGGTLAPGTSCTFSVELLVPSDAVGGLVTSVSSALDATIDAISLSGMTASAEFRVAQVLFRKSYIDDPVRPGQTATLEFSFQNISSEDATDLFFSENLSSTLSGLVGIQGTLTDVCGVGSQLIGAGSIFFVGGNLLAGESCSFQLQVQVPLATTAGSYPGSTSALSGTLGTQPVFLPAASDTLLVADPLLLSKSFSQESAAAGTITTLSFTLANADLQDTASALSFSDDLEAALTGLVAVGIPLGEPCGPGSQISGTDLLSFTGGSLAAGDSCTFEVLVQLPLNVAPGTQVDNVTSPLSGELDGQVYTAPAATAWLDIDLFDLTTSFSGTARPSEALTLSFTLQSALTTDLQNLRLSDDLEATLSGLVASALPADGFCGATSHAEGTDIVSFSGLSLAAGANCNFDIEVTLPADAMPGSYPNFTSALALDGVTYAVPALATLEVQPLLPLLGTSFTPSNIHVDQSSLLRFTLDNSTSRTALSELVFATTLPAGLTTVSAPESDCPAANVSLNMDSIDLTMPSLAEGTACTLTVEVSAAMRGDYLTDATLSSNAGDSTSAMSTLFVRRPPSIVSSFTPNSIQEGDETTFSALFTNEIDISIGSLGFIQSLPAGLRIASPDLATNTCGGALAANDTTQSFVLTSGMLPANSSCLIEVLVIADEAGEYTLDLEVGSSEGLSTSSATLSVAPGSGGGGCCSVATNKNRIPFEPLLLLALWVVSARRRRNQ